MSAWSSTLNILGLQLDTSTPHKLQDDEIRNTKADDSLDISGVEEDTYWSCELCSFSNKYKSNFNKHVKTHQLDPNSTNCDGKKLYVHVCSQCGKSYKTSYGLSLHTKNIHDLTFQYKCDTCQKGFNQMAHFRSHLSSHTKALGHKCGICKEYFCSSPSLKRHLLICSQKEADEKGRRNFTCDQCGSSFSANYSLMYHIRGANMLTKHMVVLNVTKNLRGDRFSVHT